MQSIMGIHPGESNALRMKIHPSFISYWKYYASNGLPKEERKALTEKYNVPEDLAAPALNELMRAKLSERALKRDAYRQEAQQVASVALSLISAVLTMAEPALDSEEGLSEEEFRQCIDYLTDAAKLLAGVQSMQSESRRAFILPRFSKAFQEAMKNAKPDKYLFGKDLSNKIKDLKDSDRLFKDIAKEVQPKPKTTPYAGNQRRPLGPRTFPNKHQGATGSQGFPKRKPSYRKSGQVEQKHHHHQNYQKGWQPPEIPKQ